ARWWRGPRARSTSTPTVPTGSRKPAPAPDRGLRRAGRVPPAQGRRSAAGTRGISAARAGLLIRRKRGGERVFPLLDTPRQHRHLIGHAKETAYEDSQEPGRIRTRLGA